MGVPALFRWLSKKYPKIVLPVVEEEEVKVPDEDGKDVVIPVNITQPNPNGVEFDNLYLDMNGIVHPCTHPEGKPPPETEEEMMVEIFQYTERVVNMIRPRKLLLMAIDGVAPRAKMNQQRSRRFRSAHDAKQKEEARQESIAMWQSMGQTITEDEKNKVAWDSNAITPGTPFMDLLAQSLKYWVVQKMNTDAGWKNLQVIISDASVPGEGEHKIMDFIRRQRTNPGHDPNTNHVIYGLDADLIMLSLATHEVNFRVLREDVFFQEGSATACRICGQEGHYAAQCTGQKKIKADEHDVKSKPVEKKPFIFLDVSILREYLEIELNVPQNPIPFNLEQAIDDWVFLIFFVGNDFLPHLPSLEIREGAIDTLLKIWREEFPRMGGYLTDHGKVVYSRAEIIIEGLARREDEIFRRRREAEERQDQNAKRRKLEAEAAKVNGGSMATVTPSPALQLTAKPAVPPTFHALPPRPTFDSFDAQANALGFGAPVATPISHTPAAIQAIGGSASDWVRNRASIRMANMSAAEILKAEMAALTPVKSDSKQRNSKPTANATTSPSSDAASNVQPEKLPVTENSVSSDNNHNGSSVPANSTNTNLTSIQNDAEPLADATLPTSIDSFISESITMAKDISNIPALVATEISVETSVTASDSDMNATTNDMPTSEQVDESPRSVKRKYNEITGEEDESFDPDEDDDAPPDAANLSFKVNADGTVEQEDTVKLWEPGYKERYYRQKFGVEPSDTEFRKKITTSYMEGLTWVLHYYYQGTPSWQWYYPYHFAPFAADFTDVKDMDVKFDLGQPFKPFEQLMGVFPPASRKHIPEAFQGLMVEEDSPILDFYPETFDIDMNGKKMAWQGVALLPFLDEKRLLEALASRYPKLTEDEVRRNKWGSNFLYVSEEHPLYPLMENLYTKRKSELPVPLNVQLSGGISGSVLADTQCIPGSTYYSPLTTQALPDIHDDRSISALYYFPKQLRPHMSILLQGARRPLRVLNSADAEVIRNGGRGRPRGYANGGRQNYNGRDSNGYSYDRGAASWTSDRGFADRGYSERTRGDYSSYGNAPPPRSYYQQTDYRGGNSGNYNYRGGAPDYGRNQAAYGNSYGSNQYAPQSNQYGQSYNQSYQSGADRSGTYGGGGYGGYGGYGGTGGTDRGTYAQSMRGVPPVVPSYSGSGTRSRGRGRY